MERIDKRNYYLDIAESVLERGTCLRRNYGAIIVKNDEIVATGYTGAPRGRKNCADMNFCMREHLNIPSGQRYELCRSVHAEANAIISAQRSDMIGAMCRRLIINAGIEMVVTRDKEKHIRAVPVWEWVENDDSIYKLED